MSLLDQGSGIEGRRTIAAGAAIVLAVAACAKTTGGGSALYNTYVDVGLLVFSPALRGHGEVNGS